MPRKSVSNKETKWLFIDVYTRKIKGKSELIMKVISNVMLWSLMSTLAYAGEVVRLHTPKTVGITQTETEEDQLLNAVVKGDCVKAAFLLKGSVSQGSGLLCLAILAQQTEMSRLLITYTRDINAKFDGFFPLQMAVETENEEVVDQLLVSNAKADVVDQYKSNVLHFLPDSGSNMLHKLIKAGANPTAANSAGLTPLHNAAIKGFSKIIHNLILYPKVDINARDTAGRTPLHLALWSSKEAAALELIKLGADINARSSFNEYPLDIAEKNSLLSNVKKELIKRKARTYRPSFGDK